MKNLPAFCRTVLLATLACLWASCASVPKPKAHRIRLTVDPALAGTTVIVDLVGVNSSDLKNWEARPVTDYWQPGSSFRRDAHKVTFEFGRDTVAVQTLEANHAIWAEWLRTGCLYVVVIVDIPVVTSAQAGAVDTRRLVLPLDKAVWRGHDTIEVTVLESGLRLMTPIK